MQPTESRLKDGTSVSIVIKAYYIFQMSAVLQTDGLLQTHLPHPEGWGYLKCRLSGDLHDAKRRLFYNLAL